MHRRLVLLLICGLTIATPFFFILFSTVRSETPVAVHQMTSFEPLRAELRNLSKRRPDPVKWLAENGNNKYAVSKRMLPEFPISRRPRAALISLVRNSELVGLRQSMQQLEYRWNRKYQVHSLLGNDQSVADEC